VCGGCGGVPTLRKIEWWPNGKRRFALNAAEAHRWQTGHRRVVARGFGEGCEGHIVMEVGTRDVSATGVPSAGVRAKSVAARGCPRTARFGRLPASMSVCDRHFCGRVPVLVEVRTDDGGTGKRAVGARDERAPTCAGTGSPGGPPPRPQPAGAQIEHLDLFDSERPALSISRLHAGAEPSAQVVWCTVVGRKRKLGGDSHLVARSGLRFTTLTAVQRAALADSLRHLAITVQPDGHRRTA